MSKQYYKVNRLNEIQIVVVEPVEDHSELQKIDDAKLIAFQKKTGYEIIQEFGQRKTGPPPFWKDLPPPKGCEVFVGNLPKNMIEDEIFPIFQSAGVIYEFRLMVHFSLFNKGFAFVTYASKEEAQRAIALLNGFEIRPGRRLGVLKSRDNRKLIIADLPTDKSKEEIFEEISKHTSVVIGVTIYINDSMKTKNPGFAVVEYESHRDAILARKVLGPPGEVKLFGREVIFDWAGTEADDENVKPVTILLIQNVPFDVNEEYLYYIVSMQGTIPVHSISKVENFALVHYTSKDDAELVSSKLDGLVLSKLQGNKMVDFSLKLTIVKPSAVYSTSNQNYTKKQRQFLDWNARFWTANGIYRISPVKILSELCQMNHWAEPVFHTVLISSSPDHVRSAYTTRVYIPNLPYPVKLFTNTGIFFSAAESKSFAADTVLMKIASMQSKKFGSNQVPGLMSAEKTIRAIQPTNLFDKIVPKPQPSNLFLKTSDVAPNKSIWDDVGLPNFLTNGILPPINEVLNF